MPYRSLKVNDFPLFQHQALYFIRLKIIVISNYASYLDYNSAYYLKQSFKLKKFVFAKP